MDLKLAPWQQDVAKKYQDSVPDYVTNTTTGKQRDWFKYEEDAVLEMILEVHNSYFSTSFFMEKESMTYDVVQNDIALLNVYFGEHAAMGKYVLQQIFLLIMT